MTFADMVNKYLPHYNQLDNENVVKKMFEIGGYSISVSQEREVGYLFKCLFNYL